MSQTHTPRNPLETLCKPEANSYSYRKQSFDKQQPQQFAIDAVLIDFNMPRMNGPDAIVEMRKMGFRGPIIGVSGGEEEAMTQFLQAGADDVLQKPAKTDQLVNMLLRGFEQVIRDETRGNSRENSSGESEDGTHSKSTVGSEDGNNNKSANGIDNQAPTSENGPARHQRIEQLRQFLETLTLPAKKHISSPLISTSP